LRYCIYENGALHRLTATATLRLIGGNKSPHFSITGTIDRKAKNGQWVDDRGGCIHDDIAKRIPSFASMIKWHLAGDEPLHYIANSLYHAGFSNYPYARNIDYLAKTCIYGALPTDSTFNLETADKDTLTDWLTARADALMQAYIHEAALFFGVSPREYEASIRKNSR